MHPEYQSMRRRIHITGYVALAVGFIGLSMPLLPGILFIILGLAILSAHSRIAHQYVASVGARHPKITHNLERLETWAVRSLNLTIHSHEYLTISARNNRSLRILLEKSSIRDAGVAIVLHSASGTKETAVTAVLAETLRAQGHTVIRFDAYNGLGTSAGGAYTLFTASNYYEDLEDVLEWAHTQEWWQEPVTLAGHSVGGLVATRYAQEHPDQVQALNLFAPTVSGNSLQHAYEMHIPDILASWRKEGIRQTPHPFSNEIYGLGISFLNDILQYDLLPQADKLTMPVRIVLGTDDTVSTPEDCKQLVTAIGTNATFTTLSNLTHNPTQHQDLQLLRSAFMPK